MYSNLLNYVSIYFYGCFACMDVIACGGQKRALDTLEPELQRDVGAGKGTAILWKSSQCP